VNAAEPLLSARGLRCRLGGRQVLDGVDLELERGQAWGLLGPNGAGKTTLLRAIAGAAPADEGQVWLAGERVDGYPLSARARRGIGYLPQHPSAFAGLSVAQNLLAALEIMGLPKGERRARLDELLETFGLAARAGQRAGTLSGGERRRLELARLWATRPQVLLLDEPFAGLDHSAIAELSRQIARLAGASAAVVLAEHRVEQALTICQHACILLSGRVATRGTAAEVASHPAAERVLFASAEDTEVESSSGARGSTLST
jgi:lipopolysaccharide export system ATP-binding protein